MTEPRMPELFRDRLPDDEVAAANAPVGPSPEAVGIGIEVAHTWAGQDRLDPHRPTLGQLVAEVVDRRAPQLGRRATDAPAPDPRERELLIELLTTVERVMRHSPTLRMIDTAVPAAATAARRHLGGMPAR